MSDAALTELAEAAGLQVRWQDAAGEPKTVKPDSLRAILTAMGVATGDADLADSRQRLSAEARAAASSFASVTVGGTVRLALPAGTHVELVDDDRDRHTPAVHADGEHLSFEAPSSPGYYTLEHDDGRLTLAVAPQRVWTVEDAAPGRKLWGAAAQLYGLRGRRPAPFGDFGALADMATALGRRGADALAISPVHALFAADPSRYGPYAPSTRLFLNILFADPSLLDPAARSGGAGDAFVSWERDGAEKLVRLRELHDRRREEDAGEVARFRAEGGADLEGHARFEALHAHFRAETGAAGWQAWPEPYHHPQGPAVEAFAREHAAEVDFHVWLQWLADRSLAAAQAAASDASMAVGLIADLAVGMDAGGSHAWSRPDDLIRGLSVGAPPDVFQPAGQDWGLAAFSPAALRRSGFDAFISTLRAAMKHAGGVRIDHAMGLQRLWLTPHSVSPAEGAYLGYPRDDMLRLIALESWRHKAIVVGEDLGTVPEGFREATTAMGMFGMRVLWFEREADEGFIPPQRWSAQAMAMTSTHDLPTVAGWWRERDIDWLERLNRRSRHADPAAERAHREEDRDRLWRACEAAGVAEGLQPPPSGAQEAVDAAVAYVARAGCDLTVVPLEDLLGLEEQPNHPGTTTEAPNWRYRLAADPDTELDAPRAAARIARLNAERPRPDPQRTA
jgi:4-alpha-glucanotransferase